MMYPTIHINGTSKDVLLSHQLAAYEAVESALDALYETSPNPRDYYPIGEHAFTEAVMEHGNRVERLKGVLIEIADIIEHINS